MERLSDVLRGVAAAHPGHPAIVEDGRRVDYATLAAGVGAAASCLGAAGAGPGATIALLLPNGLAFVRSFFALAHLGAAVLPLNPILRERELAAVIAEAGVRLVATSPELREQATRVAALRPAGGGRVLVVDGRAVAWPAVGEATNDPFLYLHSSGSTGRPKRVARSQGLLLAEVRRLIPALGFSPDDRVLAVAPFSHVNGLMRSMVAGLLSGATLVPLPRFERRLVAHTIEERRISVFIGVPFMFAMLAESRWPVAPDFSSLRLCISSSAPLPTQVAAKFSRRYGRPIRQLYGTTETGSVAVDMGPESALATDCVGVPLDGVEVGIFTESRQPVPEGETGDIGIRSPAAASGHLDESAATVAAFRDGYFFPGDVGRKDAAGRIYLVGRKSLFINRGGYKVNPYELEALIRGHPKVQEVAVVGVDSPFGDQRVKAVVVPSAPCGESEIIDFCRENVADFKVPGIVEFRRELPTTPTGKILRQEL